MSLAHLIDLTDADVDIIARFLSDVRVAGSLTEKDIRRSYLPIISWVPFVST